MQFFFIFFNFRKIISIFAYCLIAKFRHKTHRREYYSINFIRRELSSTRIAELNVNFYESLTRSDLQSWRPSRLNRARHVAMKRKMWLIRCVHFCLIIQYQRTLYRANRKTTPCEKRERERKKSRKTERRSVCAHADIENLYWRIVRGEAGWRCHGCMNMNKYGKWT